MCNYLKYISGNHTSVLLAHDIPVGKWLVAVDGVSAVVVVVVTHSADGNDGFLMWSSFADGMDAVACDDWTCAAAVGDHDGCL